MQSGLENGTEAHDPAVQPGRGPEDIHKNRAVRGDGLFGLERGKRQRDPDGPAAVFPFRLDLSTAFPFGLIGQTVRIGKSINFAFRIDSQLVIREPAAAG